MQISDNLSLLLSSQVIDVISNQVANISGSPTLSVVDAEYGTGAIVASNQIVSIRNTSVFSKLINKGSISFWSKCPFLGSNKSVPIVGIGSSTYKPNFADPQSGMIYFYFKPDVGFNEGEARMHVSMVDPDGVVNSFSCGPVEIFTAHHYIFSFNLVDGIISMYIDGQVVDLESEASSVVPSSLNHDASHDLVINKFASIPFSGLKSGSFEISDIMIYSDFISDISDIAFIINSGSFQFLRRKTGQLQGELPNILPPAIAQEFNRGRINSAVNGNFGVLAGTDDGTILIGSEKIWQRKISFGNPVEVENIKFKKVASYFNKEIKSDGFLSVRGANFSIF